MACLDLVATSDEVTLVAATEKTVLQLQAPANQRLRVKSLRVTGKQPAGGSDTPVKLRISRCIAANAGTGTTATPGKLNPSNPETVQTIVKKNNSVEPSTLTDLFMNWDIQPQGGIIEFFPPNLYIEVPSQASSGLSVLNFMMTSPGTPVLTLTVNFEE